MDFYLFQLINSLAGWSHYLDLVWIFLGKYLIYIIALLVLVVFVQRGKRYWFKLVGGGVVAYAFNYLVGHLYFRSRPFVTHKVIQLIEKSAQEKSFPSDHATLAFFLAVSIYSVNRKLGKLTLVLALLVALGRVLVGVHYPGDVLAGAIVGTFFAWLIVRR
ncbi:phosphatase PAP2 family protein [Candidatus Uhrbacteria bacterium]|nr:phosphatase PAP2 family protein [Candidatus Uhrbacteria bacterium]